MLVVLLLNSVSCSTTKKKGEGKPLDTCILDFSENFCWVNKETREGISFMLLAEKQQAQEGHVGPPAFFLVNGIDMVRIHKTLNRCQQMDEVQ